jgi:hypothetical protein
MISSDGAQRPRLRVLHIPAWYPRPETAGTVSGTFVREHVHSAALYDDVAVLDFMVRSAHWPGLDMRCEDDEGVPSPRRAFGAFGRTIAYVLPGYAPGGLVLTWLAARRTRSPRALSVTALPNGRCSRFRLSGSTGNTAQRQCSIAWGCTIRHTRSERSRGLCAPS